MSCILFTNNLSKAAIAADAQVSFGTTIHRKGTAARLENGEIVIRMGCSGYAVISGVANVAPTAEGEISLTITENGNAIQTITVTAGAAGDSVAIPFEVVIKGNCCNIANVAASVSAAATLISMPVTTTVL